MPHCRLECFPEKSSWCGNEQVCQGATCSGPTLYKHTFLPLGGALVFVGRHVFDGHYKAHDACGHDKQTRVQLELVRTWQQVQFQNYTTPSSLVS